jgi:hypothetical protein
MNRPAVFHLRVIFNAWKACSQFVRHHFQTGQRFEQTSIRSDQREIVEFRSGYKKAIGWVSVPENGVPKFIRDSPRKGGFTERELFL